MSFFKRKLLWIFAAVFICAILIAAASHFWNGLPAKAFKKVLTPVEKIAARVTLPAAKWRDSLMNASKLEEENEELRAQVNELLAENRGVREYSEENERLRGLLRLRDEMTDKKTVAATVTSADSDDFSYTVTINRGSSDGISLEAPVVSVAGVVGRVCELGKHWASVTTLLSPEHALGVKVSRTGDMAVAEGDLTLAKDRLCRLDYITGSGQLIEGDILVTSGNGGIYPPGLIVGKVSQVRTDNSGVLDYASVEPAADFKKLYEVLVITDWSSDEQYTENVTSDEDIPLPEPEDSDVLPEDIQSAEG